MNTKQILSSILKISNHAITSKPFLQKHRIGNAFSRTGKLSFENLIYFILQSTHKSLSSNYSQLMDSFSDQKIPFVSKQAVSKARQKISHEAFVDLFRISVEQFYKNPSKLPLWNGFHIYAIDGSTIQIPETSENYREFGGNPNNTQILSPLASVSVLYDVLNDILVDVSLHSYRHSERSSTKEHIHFLPQFPNSVILFDRGYPSEELFRFLHSQDILFLMRVPASFKKCILKQQDTLFSYPAAKEKEELVLRSCHFSLDNGTTEYIVTNIMPEQMESSAFPSLYHLRWGVESKYTELKNRLEIESFNSLKPICLKQEFFAAMYLSNLAAIMKLGADLAIVPLSGNKHKYQANRSFILNRIKSKIIILLKAPAKVCNKIILQILQESSKTCSIIRSGR